MINHYGDLLTAGNRVDAIAMDDVLRQLDDYADYHFHDEELMMAQVGLDQRHRQQHIHLQVPAMITRNLERTVRTRLTSVVPAVVLLGPRQVGKTTLALPFTQK